MNDTRDNLIYCRDCNRYSKLEAHHFDYTKNKSICYRCNSTDIILYLDKDLEHLNNQIEIIRYLKR